MAGRKPDVTGINPYSAGEKTGQVEAMFDHIASAYDRMNSIMTFGMHTRWRTKALEELRTAGGTAGPLLDVATGTGDVAIHLRKLFPESHITGVDLSEGMMSVARRKTARRHLREIDFIQADCLHMPFADETFAAVTVAYGVRNFADLEAGYREMYRVMRHGARLCVIELCEPASLPLKICYRIYARTLIPLAGRIVSGDHAAYSYLPKSVAACPQRRGMTDLIEKAGFTGARWKVLPPGVVAIYTAVKE